LAFWPQTRSAGVKIKNLKNPVIWLRVILLSPAAVLLCIATTWAIILSPIFKLLTGEEIIKHD
jgi:hypothetical protein